MGLVCKNLIPLIMALSTAGNLCAQADTDLEKEEQEPSAVSHRPIEEIQVIGERTLLVIRNQIIREEENLYRLFNDLNGHDRFDISCKTERTTRSYIPRRECNPKFFTDLRQESARFAVSEIRQAVDEDGFDQTLFQLGLERIETSKELKGKSVGDYAALNEEILRIATENPDYLEALLRVARLKEEYQATRRQRFEED